MKVLIAYDGSEFGVAALADLHRAGLHDVEALVLSVGEVWLPPGEMLSEMTATQVTREALHVHRERATQHARAVAERGVAWVREHFPRWGVTAEGAAGSPVEVIVRRADSWAADLVVLGAHGHAAAPRMYPGSVSLAALRHVPRSVRIARHPTVRGNSATRLILALDGSADSQVVLEQVRARAWPVGTQVRVLTAVDTRLIPLTFPGLSVGPTSEHWAGQVAERGADLLKQCGLAAFPSVERGDPKHVILEAARSWAADCVFVGARGLTRLPWLHLGSVSTAVAMRAPCSVEVVRDIGQSLLRAGEP